MTGPLHPYPDDSSKKAWLRFDLRELQEGKRGHVCYVKLEWMVPGEAIQGEAIGLLDGEEIEDEPETPGGPAGWAS